MSFVKRLITVIIGSDSDFPQCSAGLAYLKDEELGGHIDVIAVYTMSIHRNYDALRKYLGIVDSCRGTDVIIAGAGMAAHLPGMIDAILGYSLGNQQIHVIGVAFEDRKDPKNTLAAELSISRVPGTRVIHSDEDGPFIGPSGFLRACKCASTAALPALNIPKSRPSKTRSLMEALEFIEQAFATATSTN